MSLNSIYNFTQAQWSLLRLMLILNTAFWKVLPACMFTGDGVFLQIKGFLVFIALDLFFQNMVGSREELTKTQMFIMVFSPLNLDKTIKLIKMYWGNEDNLQLESSFCSPATTALINWHTHTPWILSVSTSGCKATYTCLRADAALECLCGPNELIVWVERKTKAFDTQLTSQLRQPVFLVLPQGPTASLSFSKQLLDERGKNKFKK